MSVSINRQVKEINSTWTHLGDKISTAINTALDNLSNYGELLKYLDKISEQRKGSLSVIKNLSEHVELLKTIQEHFKSHFKVVEQGTASSNLKSLKVNKTDLE